MNGIEPVAAALAASRLDSLLTTGPTGAAGATQAGASALAAGTAAQPGAVPAPPPPPPASAQTALSAVALTLDAIVRSVKKTRRCVVVHEATRTSGFGAELTALVQEHCFYHLEAPIERVTGWDTPYPHAQEWAYFPGPARVGAAFKRAMEK